MNSCTSSSEPHRRYVLGLMALVLLPVSCLFIVGVYLEPLSGDLTRIGWYAERSFGWTRPQLEFAQPLYTAGPYNRHHEVVVLGDSFSANRPRLQWQNYLVAATDWSLVTLDLNKIGWEKVLESRVFRETPPRIFVLESVERALPGWIKGEPCDAPASPQRIDIAPPPPPVLIGTLPGRAGPVERETAWHEVKLGFVVKYLWNGARRGLSGVEHSEVRKVELREGAPFSSRNQRAMLVYRDDFRKVSAWRDLGLPGMDCRIERIRKQVEANGRTRFVLMVAPDKLTAYAGFLRDETWRDTSALAALAGRHPKVMPRLDLALTSAIRAGEQDVYLPDDTHWGSNGHRIAAETLLGFLRFSP